MKENILLWIDAIVNLVLGISLLFFPRFVFEALGIRLMDGFLFPGILGGVLTGIGVALIVERYRDRLGIRGLGLGGAISINLFGAGALAFWLAHASLEIPASAYEIFWVIIVVVFGIAVAELFSQLKRDPQNGG